MKCVKWALLFVLGVLFSTLPVLVAQTPGPGGAQSRRRSTMAAKMTFRPSATGRLAGAG